MEMKSFVRANLDRVLAAGLVVAGLIALLVGWIGISGSGLAAEQLPYLISGGLGGIALIAIGCTMWVSADLQDEWRRLDALEERLGSLRTPTAAAAIAVDVTETLEERPAPRPRRRAAPKPREAQA
jgi:hypothetical protein